MTPWHKERIVVSAAEWMWWNQKKNDPALWWVPSDLTDDNVDKSNPRLSLEDAQTVFEELKSRGLLRIGRVSFFRKKGTGEEEHQMVVFFIQRHKEKAWLRLIDKGFWGIYIGSLFKDAKAVTLSVLIFVLAAILGGFLTSIGEDVYGRVKGMISSTDESSATQPPIK
jgi:hypothetical protein